MGKQALPGCDRMRAAGFLSPGSEDELRIYRTAANDIFRDMNG